MLQQLSLLATAHVGVGIDRSETNTSVFKAAHGQAVTVVCSPAKIVLGTATRRASLVTCQAHLKTHGYLATTIGCNNRFRVS